jgi:hypothetical protein
MILTCDVTRREIEAGRVVIEPFFADARRCRVLGRYS